MSCYLYFTNNLKRHKRPYIGLYDNLQKLSPINGNSFKENLYFQLPLIFYSSVTFIFETVFFSELIAGNSFGAL